MDAHDPTAATMVHLLAALAHDLRGPLNAMRMGLAGLHDPEVQADEREFYVGAIERSIGKCDRLLANVVTLAKLQANVLPITKLPTKICALVQQVVDEHRQQAQQASVVVTVQAEEEFTANVDRDRVRELLAIVIKNALSHGASGKFLEVSVRRDDNNLEVRVSDGGPGIPSEQADGIFEPFWAPFWQQQPRRAVGLGLATARGIARAHKGSLALLASAPGAVFVATLPLT